MSFLRKGGLNICFWTTCLSYDVINVTGDSKIFQNQVFWSDIKMFFDTLVDVLEAICPEFQPHFVNLSNHNNVKHNIDDNNYDYNNSNNNKSETKRMAD